MNATSWLALAALVVVLGGCATSYSPARPLTPKDLVMNAGPTGFTATVDQDVPVGTAARVLPTDPAPTGAILGTAGYRDGYNRVWTRGDESLSVLLFEFSTSIGPAQLVAFERENLRSHQAVTLFDDADLAGSQAFNLFGVPRSGSRQVFCQGVIFPVDRYLVVVDDCAGRPAYSGDPLAYARRQDSYARHVMGAPAPTPTS